MAAARHAFDMFFFSYGYQINGLNTKISKGYRYHDYHFRSTNKNNTLRNSKVMLAKDLCSYRLIAFG